MIMQALFDEKVDLSSSIPETLVSICCAILPVIFAISLAATVKRLRDIGWSAWCLIVYFFLNIIMFLICMLLPGQEKPAMLKISDQKDGVDKDDYFGKVDIQQ